MYIILTILDKLEKYQWQRLASLLEISKYLLSKNSAPSHSDWWRVLKGRKEQASNSSSSKVNFAE